MCSQINALYHSCQIAYHRTGVLGKQISGIRVNYIIFQYVNNICLLLNAFYDSEGVPYLVMLVMSIDSPHWNIPLHYVLAYMLR